MANNFTFDDLIDTFNRSQPALTYEARDAGGNVKRTESISGVQSEFGTLPRLNKISDNTLMTYSEVLTEMDRLVATYVVTQSTYGQSVQSRDLRILKTTNVGKPILLITCGIHGDEIRSLRGWFNSVEWLLSSTSQFALDFRANWNLYFVPMVNPDAVFNVTRQNANNINLNRNWPYFFDQATDTDKGAAALDQPETQLLVTALTPDYANIQVVLDIHDWSSQSTFGFLTEQIYHNIDTMRLQRTLMGFMNTTIAAADYVISGNGEWIESRSERRPYLYTHFRQYGAESAYGGILEFPEAESVSTVCNVAQDAFVAIISTCANFTLGIQSATVVESSSPPMPANNNPNLLDWHSTDPRPSWYSKSGLVLTQYSDPDLDAANTGVLSNKPGEFILTQPRARTGFYSQLKSSGFREMWFAGGRTASVSYSDAIYYVDGEAGSQTQTGTLPSGRQYLSCASDATTLYISGGYGGTYLDEILTSTLDASTMTTTAWVSQLIITGGLQRHTSIIWGNKLLLIGGRNSAGYRADVVAVDLTTNEQYKIANLSLARGYLSSELDGNNLYVLGGYTGSYKNTVDKITLVDNFIARGTDGVTVESGGAATGDFKSTSYTFTAGNVGDVITIQAVADVFPVQTGAYTISAYVDANTVTLSTTPPYSTGVNTGLSFTITSPAPTMSVTTPLPAAQAYQFTSVKAGTPNEILLFGGRTAGGTKSNIVKYTMETTPVVSTITYTLDTYTDPETGVTTTIEEPKLQASAGYYSVEKDSIMIFGGQDESSVMRDDVYEISLNTNLATLWASSTRTYGFIRPSVAFTTVPGTEYVAVVQVKNTTSTSIKDINPYVRLSANFGPLSGFTRIARSWYVVPPRDEYMTIILPFDARTSETELRLYLRHYTAGTNIAISSFQLFETREQLTYPATWTSTTRSADTLTFATDIQVNDTNDGYLFQGSFIPLVSANTNVNNIKFLSFLDENGTEQMSLSQNDTANVADVTANDGTYRCQYTPTGYDTSLPAFNVNYNKSSGKELRRDVIHWRFIDEDLDEIKLELSSYGTVKTFTIPSTIAWNLKKIVVTNGIHANVGQYLYSFNVSSNARRQIRQLNKEQAVLMLVTIDDGTGTPLRLVNNLTDITSRGSIFQAFPIKVDLSEDDGDTQQTVQLTIDNVSLEMIDWIRTLTGPIPAKIEIIFSGDPDVVEVALTDLVIRNISYNDKTITATLSADDDLNQAIPSDTYNSLDFAGLF